MKLKHILIFIFSFWFVATEAQNASANQQDRTLPVENYEENIKKEFINDIYIPKNIDEALEELVRLGDGVGIEKFKNAQEEVVAKKLHFGLGRWIMTKWNFHNGSRYSHYLREKGLSYPDDMARFTIISLHRHLNDIDLDVDLRIKAVKELRDKEYQEKLAKKKLIKEIVKEKG